MGIRVFFRSNRLKSVKFFGLHRQPACPGHFGSQVASRRLAPAIATIIAVTIVSISLGFGWNIITNQGDFKASMQDSGCYLGEKNSQAPSLTIPRAADATNVTDYTAD